MNNSQPISTFLGIAAAVVLATNGHAVDIFVNGFCGNDAWSGLTEVCLAPDRPKATIQAGITAANHDDVVIVAQGEYFENINFNGKAITVRSTDPNDPRVVMHTIINAGGSGSVVTCTSGEGANTVLSGFVITRGYGSDGNGGGMYNESSSPTVTNCTFSANSADSAGGGMFNASSSPTVTNCSFSGNTASISFEGGMLNFGGSFSANTASSFGGGMYNASGSNPRVTNCSFSGNTASSSGGGLYNATNSNARVTNCTFIGNSATNGGGGMYNLSSNPTVARCTFVGNSATNGGGMFNSNSSPMVNNCSFSGNSASTSGGGMRNTLGSPTVTNCSFSGNTAPNGGGMFNLSSKPTVTNTGFCDNTPDQIDGDPIIDGGGNSLLYCPPPIPKPNSCPSDINGSGAINMFDLSRLLLCLGQPAAPECLAEDINFDGSVDLLDLIDLLLAFGAPCPLDT